MKTTLLVLVGLYCVALIVMIRFYYRAAKQEHDDFKFSYSIVELWAGIVGVTPAFLVLNHLNQRSELREIMPYETAVLFLGQVTGIIIVKCVTFPIRSQLGAAGAILTGSIIGLFIPVFVLFVGILILAPVFLIVKITFDYFPFTVFGALPFGAALIFWLRFPRSRRKNAGAFQE